jgi:three-Cys-motif partner protein
MMPGHDEVLWELNDHTLGKHLVLRRYLQAWFPILGSAHDKIAFIDGFAGPGEYVGGEEGSPVIALKALADHTARIRARANFWFIEADPRRSQHLETVIEPLKAALGDRAAVTVTTGRFDETLGGLLTIALERNQQLVPAFVMVDPFGVSHTPMSVIRSILQNPRSEVYISFMSAWINRFNEEPGFEAHLDSLFGSPDWRQIAEITEPRARQNFLFDLYKRCLKQDQRAKYVLHFELYRGRELVYTIFFATGSELGCERMKEAIWKIDPINGSRFVPGNEAVLDLFTADPTRFEIEIEHRMNGGDWISIGELQKWAMTDQTAYPATHLKRALKSMERDNRIEVDATTRTRRGSYPPGTKLKLAGDR